MREKICPVVHRLSNGHREVLAFAHPLAGNQFVKGTIEYGETLPDAALRELREESGLEPDETPYFLGKKLIGSPPVTWYFYALEVLIAPDNWEHYANDDGGHTFIFSGIQ